MSPKTSSILIAFLALICLVFVTAFLNTSAQAQSTQAGGIENKCMTCHENLYFLHDTGNWFCLRESPMRCVDCHGGDPEAVTQELAHAHRAAHPILNEDISKCQQCHPDECNERVELFDQTAGISQVRVAVPYTPAYSSEDNVSVSPDVPEQEEPGSIFVFWEVIPLTVIVGLAFIVYMIHHTLHKKSK